MDIYKYIYLQNEALNKSIETESKSCLKIIPLGVALLLVLTVIDILLLHLPASQKWIWKRRAIPALCMDSSCAYWFYIL